MEYVILLKEARDLLVMCTLLDKSGLCNSMVEKIDRVFTKHNINNTSPEPNCEYEMLINDEGGPFEINSWIPIANEMIKDLSKIDYYIESGLLRKKQS